MWIAVDAMGGDNAPDTIINGVVQACKEYGYKIILVGDEGIIRRKLKQFDVSGLELEIVHASQVVTMDDAPAHACRQKKDSSIMVALRLLKEGKANACVSAGNSGAIMAASLMHLKRLPGVNRPAIASIMPTKKGMCTLIDVGANVDCKAKNLLQFAIMGSVYFKDIFGVDSPRVGLLNIGEESTKGDELRVEAFSLLQKSNLNFVGNLEGKDLLQGKADVVICDGFVGNIILKLGEGVAEMMLTLIKEEINKKTLWRIAAYSLKRVFKNVKKRINYEEYGGAPLLGVSGLSVICHGSSSHKAIKNAIKVAAELISKSINQEICTQINKYNGEENCIKQE
ncbi:phosphate acyltransferase PlsX [bacterium]|nr:phosphate acyltransferase PlsX [bacterium]